MFGVEYPSELPIVKKTAGLPGYIHSVDEVREMFGIDPRNWPHLFMVSSNGLVARKERHEEIFQFWLANVRDNRHRLGIN